MQELWFLHSARRRILIDIYMKFHEDTLNSFQVIEQTRFCILSILMQELWFLCIAPRLMLTDIYIKFLKDSLNSFQVNRADTIL